MKGLDKFKTEIKAEVNKIKDDKKQKLITEQMNHLVEHIESVCDDEYDNLLAQDHKSFVRMWKFVTDNARKYAVNNCAMVSDSVVYGWVDEYVGLDDKKAVESEIKKQKTTTKIESKPTAIDKRIKEIQEEVHKRHAMEDVSIFDMM